MCEVLEGGRPTFPHGRSPWQSYDFACGIVYNIAYKRKVQGAGNLPTHSTQVQPIRLANLARTASTRGCSSGSASDQRPRKAR